MDQNRASECNIHVCCRFKPLTAKEKQSTVASVLQKTSETTLYIKTSKDFETNTFSFDEVLDGEASQAEVYDSAARPIVVSVLQGFNGTIFAYGQTSSGKTHTILGPGFNEHEKGIIPRVSQQIFSVIANAPSHIEYRVKVSIMELYLEKIRDLLDLGKKDLPIRMNHKKGIHVEDITQKTIHAKDELLMYMQVGNRNRVTAATAMNEKSSRSHLIFAITVHQSNAQDGSAKCSKLYIVDLAGSEKISKTGVEGKALNEANKINSSLATLSKVIKALSESKEGKQQHVPYRESKLTRLLQQSLGGNSKTSLIITCSQVPYNLQETMSTLRFGVIAKKVRNRAVVNKEKSVAQLQMQLDKVLEENAELEKKLKSYENYMLEEIKVSLPIVGILAKPRNESKKPPLPRSRSTEDSGNTSNNCSGNATVIGDEDEQKIKILEFELECQTALVRRQMEEIEDLKKTIDTLNDRISELEEDCKRNRQQLEEHLVRKNQTVSSPDPAPSSNAVVPQTTISDYELKLPLTDRTEPKTLNNNGMNESLVLLNDIHRRSVTSIVQEILALIRPEQSRLATMEELRRKKWYRELEGGTLSLNLSYQQRSLIQQAMEVSSEGLMLHRQEYKQGQQQTIVIQDHNEYNQEAECQGEVQLDRQDSHDNLEDTTQHKLMERSAEMGVFDAYQCIMELEGRWRKQYLELRKKVQIDIRQSKQIEEELRRLEEEGSQFKSRLPI